METELIPQYDTRKSFYKKARVYYNQNKKILISYNTEVCFIRFDSEGVKSAFVLGSWGMTTTRHIKEFLKQNGFKAENSKQILKDYELKENEI